MASAGFGLAEVLLASGVLILVVASIVSLSRFVIRGYAVTASRTQALYLAQEGLERVRNARDTLSTDQDPATDFATNIDSLTTGSYYAEWRTAPFSHWEIVNGPEPDIILGVGGIAFTRDTRFDVPDVDLGDARLNPHVKRVTVTVSWTESGQIWSVSAETYLTDWKPEA